MKAKATVQTKSSFIIHEKGKEPKLVEGKK